MDHFADRLIECIDATNSIGCLGLDPRWDWLPKRNYGTAHPPRYSPEQFYEEILDRIGHSLPVIKPQFAFFGDNPSTVSFLARTLKRTSKCLCIADAKRGDIGTTAEAYAEIYLDSMATWDAFDAITVNPYLGRDSVQPFVDAANKRGKGVFILVKTSNAGSHDFQDRYDHDTGHRIYELVAEMVNELGKTNIGERGYSNIGAVVGATVDEEQVGELRKLMPHAFFLMPGYGPQGGSMKSIQAGLDDKGYGVIAPSSRALNFPWIKGKETGTVEAPSDWLEQIAAAAEKFNSELRAIRSSRMKTSV